jgi:hypothetical protein
MIFRRISCAAFYYTSETIFQQIIILISTGKSLDNSYKKMYVWLNIQDPAYYLSNFCPDFITNSH